MSAHLREAILKTCLKKCDTRFADGEQANNKLDLEEIADNPLLREQVGKQIALLAKKYNPDLVVGVPQGANWLAADVADYLKIQKVLLRKNPETKVVSFANEEDKIRCEKSSRIVVIEDVFNKYTSTRRVLALLPASSQAVAAIAIWDRGVENKREPLSVESKALIAFHISAQLPEDSNLWKYVQK